MLPKKLRLNRKDFYIARSQGHAYHTLHFSYIIHTHPLNQARFSVVVSKKISKSAVVRNRLRRQIYSCLPSFPGSKDFIIFPKKSVLELSSEDLCQSLKQVTNT